MDTTQMISFIIPVRDRDIKRIKNCVKSLKSKYTGEIIIMDYGSKKPIKNIPGANIIRYNKNRIWNKSHAINLGIKNAKFDYVSTVDCDMIIHPELLRDAVFHLNENTFIYSLNVKRIEPRHVSGDFKCMLEYTSPWFENMSRNHINHSANGGIQIYPKEWIKSIGGVDESLVYWGAIDNDTYERAIMCGLTMINLNKPILHQEHKKKKEENLNPEDQSIAFEIRVEKTKYLNKMFKMNKYLRNCGKWGEDVPNQNRFLRSENERRKKIEEEKQREIEYTEKFIEAASKGENSFEFHGETIKIFS